MATPSQSQCRHPGCICTVAQGQDYCSDYCRQQSGSRQQLAQQGRSGGQMQGGSGQGCRCGHPACQHA